MQLGADADGALLQRALDGQSVDDPGIAALVTHRTRRRGARPARAGPPSDFVAELRHLLVEVPAGSAGSPEPRGPAVVRFGRRARMLVAAAAALLVLAGGIGALSRSALPGDRLYPVKQLLDRVVLELHREPVGLGRAHLDQAREHVEEAGQLIATSRRHRRDRPGRRSRDLTAEVAADLAGALDAATTSSTAAETVLREAYRSEQRVRCADLAVRLLRRGRCRRSTPSRRLPCHRSPGRRGSGSTTCSNEAATRRCASSRRAPRVVRRPQRQGRSSRAAPGATRPQRRLSARRAGSRSLEPSGRPGDRPIGTSDGPDPLDDPPRTGLVEPTAHSGRRREHLVAGRRCGAAAQHRGDERDPGCGGGGVTLPGPLPTLSLPEVGVTTSSVTVGGGGVTLPGATVSLPTITLPLPRATALTSPEARRAGYAACRDGIPARRVGGRVANGGGGCQRGDCQEEDGQRKTDLRCMSRL